MTEAKGKQNEKAELVRAGKILKYEKGFGFYSEDNKVYTHEITRQNSFVMLGGPINSYEELANNRLLPYLEERNVKSLVLFPLQTPSKNCVPSSTEDLEIVEKQLSKKGLDVLVYGEETFTIRI